MTYLLTRKSELILLSLLVLVLPSLEALKTTFWLLYLIIFTVRRYRDRSLNLFPSDKITLALWAILIVSLISTLANWPIENRFKGFFDAVRYGSLFLCMYYAGYSGREKWNIALFIIAGAIAGLLYGLVEYVANIVPNMQFHSAGVITQSAIYLGMVVILNVGMLLSAKAQDKDIKIYLWIALIIESIALVYMGSRGGLLAVFMVLVVILLVNIRIKYVAIFALATGVIVIASSALLWVFPQNSMTSGGFKQYSVERFAMADSERMENWKIAAEKIRSGQDLVLGIGPRNYKIIDPAEFGISSAYYKRSGELHHAHNLFLTRIIEQGLAGLTALLLFYILILMMLINSIRMNKGGKLEWYFYAGLAGLTIPVIAGMFNAPFYQEHAMLSMILMGIYASSPDSKVSG